MSVSVSTELLLRVAQATAEEQSAIERVLADREQANGQQGEDGEAQRHDVEGKEAQGEERERAGGEMERAIVRIENKLDRVIKGFTAALKESRGEELGDDELRRIYARVLLAAEEKDRWREAPLKEVFDCYCLKGFSAKEVAVKMGCSKTTVMNRLSALKRLTGVEPKKLRAYKPFFERAEEALREPRARRVRRRDAIYGDEPEEDGTW